MQWHHFPRYGAGLAEERKFSAKKNEEFEDIRKQTNFTVLSPAIKTRWNCPKSDHFCLSLMILHEPISGWLADDQLFWNGRFNS